MNAQSLPSRDVVSIRQTGHVAILLPDDFDLTHLPISEQRVCKAFLLGLDKTWFVIPNVPIVIEGADCEIDVVLVSAAGVGGGDGVAAGARSSGTKRGGK